MSGFPQQPTTPITKPPASSAGISPNLGVAFQNTLAYDAIFNLALVFTTATGATVSMGTGPTAAAAAAAIQNIVPTFSITAVVNLSFYIPAGYWGIVNASGTTVESIGNLVIIPA